MKNADALFRFWMRALIALFCISFAYIVIADRYAPLTTETRVQGFVVQIAPEVSGQVSMVGVENNQRVEQGDVLFTIDKDKYQIALDNARLQLQLAKEQEEVLRSNQQAAVADVARAASTFDNASKEYNRISSLFRRGLVPQAELDNASTQQKIAKSALDASQQNLKAIEAQLGADGSENTSVRIAESNLEKARLDLTNTVVYAPKDGVVTNLQLEPGAIASANKPLMTFIPSSSLWIAADFREKAVAHVDEDFIALVTYDALPGKVFHARVKSRDHGVAAAQQMPDGRLTNIEVNNRWVRDAQRTRINLQSLDPIPHQLFIGSRATVTLYPEDSVFWGLMAKIQIRLVGWLHYIY